MIQNNANPQIAKANLDITFTCTCVVTGQNQIQVKIISCQFDSQFPLSHNPYHFNLNFILTHNIFNIAVIIIGKYTCIISLCLTCSHTHSPK